MNYSEKLNLESDNPRPEIMAKHFVDMNTVLRYYREKYAETQIRFWLGKITHQSNQRRKFITRMVKQFGGIVKLAA